MNMGKDILNKPVLPTF